MSSGTLTIAGRTLGLSNLDKPLYPSGFTKGQVIDYYARIAPVLLPHLKGRALTLKRYPNGSAAAFFYEKNCPAHRPPWVRTAAVESSRSERGEIDYCLVEDKATLLWVANLASIELHTHLSKAKTPDRPTMMAFDLDPTPPAAMRDCCQLALLLRDVLAGVKLQSVVKTSGGKGLHVYVPLNSPRVTSDDTKTFSRTVAELLARQDPARVTANMAKHQRAGKILVDWSQNDQHKTTATVYSLRARPTPTVSAPVTWAEVEACAAGKTDDLSFTAPQVLARVAKLGDLFEPVLKVKQSLPRAAG
jgi:bifunctional non-homologous end joining protein LigD